MSRWPGHSLAGPQRGPQSLEILKAGSEQRPKPMARKRPPRSGQRPGERGRGERAGAGPLEAQARGRAPQPVQPSERERPGQVRSRGTQTRREWPRPSGPVQLPSGNTRKLASGSGAEGPLSPRARDPRGSKEAQPSGGRQSSAGFGWLPERRAPACDVESGAGGGAPRRSGYWNPLSSSLLPLAFQTRLDSGIRQSNFSVHAGGNRQEMVLEAGTG